MFPWWLLLGYLGQLALIMARAKAMFPGRPVRTLIIVEDPGQPLDLTAVAALLAPTGAQVMPGFTFTP